MNSYFRVLFACGLLILSDRRLSAQGSATFTCGTIVAHGTSASGSEVPWPDPIIGEPYSAITETENSQTLADNTHIDRKFTQAKNFRDSQGRTRMEHYVPTSLANGDPGELASVLIHDPVAGVEYFLDPRNHTARQSLSGSRAASKGNPDTAHTALTPCAQTGGSNAPSPSGSRERSRSKVSAEDLGTQVMDGLVVDGKRTTMTIPVGAQGNDRPFEVVSERWFSKELRIYVLINTSDPRSGVNTIRMTNIERSEPDLSLFQVPPGYTITQ